MQEVVSRFIVACFLLGAVETALAQTRTGTLTADRIPLEGGATVVQAVSGDARQGDYESTLTLAPATRDGVRIQSRAFVKDDFGIRRWLVINRHLRRDDLVTARLQILGFDTADSEIVAGATAMGPSLAVVEELARSGRADHVIRNYASRRDNKGTLQHGSRVPFPLLVNGERVTVEALVARGMLGIPGSMRPWELQILDHPHHPITLKVSYGPESATAIARAEWSRQVVRIDFPQQATSVAEQLAENCRARVPGIYFEFDSDVLNPASGPAVPTRKSIRSARQSALPAVI